ncbi:MAG: hypothetical protein IJA26_07535, partial [Clostridia bacterium]|nr:hypothetical protein [Clostridia bacterium]
MATYKYQQNFYEGASAGYVQYNITPDFGAVMAPGDTFEITGKMYCGDMKRYGVAIEASIQENGFGRELGRVVKTVSKGGSTAFSAQCTVTEALANTASERGFSAYLTFMLADAADFASGAYTMANEAQKLSLVKYRLGPEISGASFSDATGAYEYFGGAVQGKSDLTAVADVTLDPLDASLYIRSARIRFGDHAIDIPGENISGSALHIGVPGFSGEFENYELQITDSSGMTGRYTGGPFAAYPYDAPRLETIGRDLVERYEVITSDDGTEIAQISDAGTSLWANFAVGTSDINGRNAWVLKRSFAESGFTLPDGEQVLAGNGGESIAVSEDRSIFPRSMVFSAGKRYTVRLEISDFFEKAIQVFDVDKAGGYFNVEKNGVSVGMRSTATEDQPKFESAYPFYAYGGIHGVTNYTTDEVKTGGTWVDGKPIYRK